MVSQAESLSVCTVVLPTGEEEGGVLDMTDGEQVTTER